MPSSKKELVFLSESEICVQCGSVRTRIRTHNLIAESLRDETVSLQPDIVPGVLRIGIMSLHVMIAAGRSICKRLLLSWLEVEKD